MFESFPDCVRDYQMALGQNCGMMVRLLSRKPHHFMAGRQRDRPAAPSVSSRHVLSTCAPHGLCLPGVRGNGGKVTLAHAPRAHFMRPQLQPCKGIRRADAREAPGGTGFLPLSSCQRPLRALAPSSLCFTGRSGPASDPGPPSSRKKPREDTGLPSTSQGQQTTCLCPSKIPEPSLQSPYDGTGRRGLWEVSRSRGTGPHIWGQCSYKRRPESIYPLPTTWGCREQAVVCPPEGSPH